MILTKQLLDILKNFSNINQSILFKPGEIVSTISPAKNILANCKIKQTIDHEFAIYDLHEFLAIASMFIDTECKFTDHQIILRQGKKQVKYTFAHPSTITCSEYKTIHISENDIITSFDIDFGDINNIIKTSAILKTEDVIIEGNDGNVVIKAGNVKDSTSNQYIFDIDHLNKPFTGSFSKLLKIDTIKLINQTYTVKIPNKKLIQFDGVETKVSYWFATNQ